MKLSARNMLSDTGVPYALVYVGDVLFFGGNLQKYYQVTHMDKRGRPFHNNVDLFELEKSSGLQSIVFEP